jgi:protein-S-isoprenylcysteine O-methyltransferase Ste14
MKPYLRLLLFLVLVAALLFGLAGRWDLPGFWIYVLIFGAACLPAIRRVDPDLVRERMHPGPGGRDRALRWVALPLGLAHWAVAGLDVGRFHWSDTVPPAMRVAAMVGLALSLGLCMWAMTVNRFYSPVVRIQSDRGHRLVTAGPYGYVRHPGYAGTLVFCLCSPLALGSWGSMAPMAILLFLLLRRTALEDRFLRQHLDGYEQYAQRVRFRLLPGMW